MRSGIALTDTNEWTDGVNDLPLEVFELTRDGLEVESLTGAGAFAGRTNCCCTAGSSTTCIPVGGGLCAC